MEHISERLGVPPDFQTHSLHQTGIVPVPSTALPPLLTFVGLATTISNSYLAPFVEVVLTPVYPPPLMGYLDLSAFAFGFIKDFICFLKKKVKRRSVHVWNINVHKLQTIEV